MNPDNSYILPTDMSVIAVSRLGTTEKNLCYAIVSRMGEYTYLRLIIFNYKSILWSFLETNAIFIS